MDNVDINNKLEILNYYISNGIIIFLSLAGMVTIAFIFDD